MYYSIIYHTKLSRAHTGAIGSPLDKACDQTDLRALTGPPPAPNSHPWRLPLPGALFKALWSLLDGIWGLLKGSWRVLVRSTFWVMTCSLPKDYNGLARKELPSNLRVASVLQDAHVAV